MKNLISAAIVALALAVLCPTSALAQWDYGQDSIYNGIEARIDARKTRDRIRARQGKSAKGRSAKQRRASRSTRKVVRRPVAAVQTLPHHDISFHCDSFQDFHQDDVNGYIVNFSLTPKSGNARAITKSYDYGYMKYHTVAEYNDIPSGTYTVRAFAIYKGKKYPVHLATQDGSPTDPKGGNFAPSLQLVVKPAKDAYGDMVVQGFPKTIYTRVIE